MLTSYISVYTDLQQNRPGEIKHRGGPFYLETEVTPALSGLIVILK